MLTGLQTFVKEWVALRNSVNSSVERWQDVTWATKYPTVNGRLYYKNIYYKASISPSTAAADL